MLPRVDLPTYTMYLKSIDKKIKYRPFTVGEQEILLRAKGNGEELDKGEMISSITDIIEKCTFGKLNIQSIPIYEIVLLFIRIRAVSVDEMVKFTYVDKTSEKQDKIVVNINLNDVEIRYPNDVSDIIELNEQYSIKMKYPTWETYEQASDNELLFISKCFDTLFQKDSDEFTDFSELSSKEVIEWYDDLPFKVKLQIEQFLSEMPTVYYKTEVKLRSGKTQVLEYTELADFFI